MRCPVHLVLAISFVFVAIPLQAQLPAQHAVSKKMVDKTTSRGLNNSLRNGVSKNVGKNVDSLRQALQSAPLDTVRVRMLVALAAAYLQTNVDEAVHSAEEAAVLAQELGFSSGKAAAYSIVGEAQWFSGEYAKALEMQHKALTLYEGLGQEQSVSTVLNKIAVVYRSRDLYSDALRVLFRASEIAERLNDRQNMAISYSTIGEIYFRQGDSSKASAMLQKARMLQEALGDKEGLASTLTTIGELAMNHDNYPAALQNYAQAMGIQLELHLQQSLAATLGSIGEAYSRQQDYDAALEAYYKSLALLQDLGDEQGIALSYNRLGALYLMLRRYDSAATYLQLGFENSSRIGARDIQLRSYQELARLDSARGDFAGAFDRYKHAMLLQEELYGTQQARRIAELLAQQDLERKEQHIEMLERDNATQLRQRNILTGLIVLALVGAVVAAAGDINNRRKNRALRLANMEIMQQNLRVEQQSQLIIIKNTELQQANYEYEYTVDRVLELNKALVAHQENTENLQAENIRQTQEIERLKVALNTAQQRSNE